MAKNTVFLWYDKDAEAAARYYAGVFPDSAVGTSTVHQVTTNPARRATC
jgi:predicted 3-demethylubiquinone-9 3-methyltransferase (glyoxalase superfamily)